MLKVFNACYEAAGFLVESQPWQGMARETSPANEGQLAGFSQKNFRGYKQGVLRIQPRDNRLIYGML